VNTLEEPGISVPRSSKAVWFDAPNSAVIQEDPVPPPGDEDITVEAMVSGISQGTEMLIYRGRGPKGQRVTPITSVGESMSSFPIKFGYQNVGRVVAAGAQSGFRKGDVVFARFPHQAFFTMKSDPEFVYRLPEGIDPEIAIFGNLLDVAVNGLLDVPVRLGDVVVVHGLGVVGLFCAQLAARTTPHVIAVDPNPARRAFAQKFGIPTVASPEEATDVVLAASGGRGADISIEASGSPRALQNAIRSTGFEGTILVISWYGDEGVQLQLSPEFHMKRQKMVSSQVNVIGSGLQPRWDIARRMDFVWHVLPSLHPKEMITHRVSFEKAQDAYQLLHRDSAALAVVLTY
jgi:2-desacetyl-2-hydroxyethyl bacteriochlorophyllide A dehydrogenase